MRGKNSKNTYSKYIYYYFLLKNDRVGKELWLENGRMLRHFLKSDLEPFGVMLRVQYDVFGDVVDAHVFPWSHLVEVDVGRHVALTDEHMVELMFRETLPNRGLINKGINFL